MIIISHRGNLTGRNPDRENTPSYILSAISSGFDVEVDLHWWNNGFWLGHDKPVWGIPETFIEEIKDKVWIHCKNLPLIEKDKVTVTSKGYIWCFPGYEVDGGIMVDDGEDVKAKIIGVCTDNPVEWNGRYESIKK